MTVMAGRCEHYGSCTLEKLVVCERVPAIHIPVRRSSWRNALENGWPGRIRTA
jgi:hypothetical protein